MFILRSLVLVPVLLVASVTLACGGSVASATTSEPPESNPPTGDPKITRPPTPNDVVEEEPPVQPPDPDRWCSKQGKHSFCADFDGESITEGWNNGFKSLASGGLTASTSDRSAPNAATVVRSKAVPALVKWIDLPDTKRAELVLDTRIDGFATDSDGLLSLFMTKGDAPLAGASLMASEQEVRLQLIIMKGGQFRESVVAALPSGKWTRIGLSLEQDADGHWSAALTYDGVAVDTLTYDGKLPAQDVPNRTLVIVGPGGDLPEGSEPFRASFDNVTFDVE